MLDFERVERAVTAPYACTICGYNEGPFTRTFQERWGEEIWVCETCVGRLAKNHGLVKGARMMELIRASRLLESKDREIARILEREAAVQAELEQERARAQGLETELHLAYGKVTQFEHMLGAVKEQLVEVPA